MTTAEILDRFTKLKALVVGDICLDRWCTYDPATSEPSRETGIPRLGIVSTEVTPGGGGTAANNLAALGAATVAVAGIRGDDGFGFELVRALNQRGITANLMVELPGWQTFTYTKLINGQTGIEDQPRVDFISTKPVPPEAETRVIENLIPVVEAFDVLLVADQAETAAGGVVTPAVRDAISKLAAQYPNKVFLVDSRKRVHLFRAVTVKPNRDEAEAACQELFDDPRRGQAAGRAAGGGRARAGHRLDRSAADDRLVRALPRGSRAVRISSVSVGSLTVPRPRHGAGKTCYLWPAPRSR